MMISYQSSSGRTLGWSLLTGLKIKSSKTEAHPPSCRYSSSNCCRLITE